MPHAANVDAPIVLVGPGRSGTSLVSDLFARHPDCAVVGETANLVFGVWYALWYSVADIPVLIENGRSVPDSERPGRLVRRTFTDVFADDRPDWMHKPIGVPRALIEQYADDPGCDEAAAMYWRVLRSSFPRGRFVTMVRHPCDVVLSSRAHWRFDERTLWRTLADLARYMTHEDAPAIHVVNYDQLVAHPEATARALFDAVGLPFRPEVLGAFDTIHVPAPGRPEPARSGFSRRQEWTALDPARLTRPWRQAIENMFARFKCPLEWPEGWTNDAGPAATPEESPEALILRLEARAKSLNTTLERARMEHARQVREREQEIGRVWTEQREWIAELERGKSWLEEQRDRWQAEAERLRALLPG